MGQSGNTSAQLLMGDRGFFRDDPVFRSRVQGVDFFQSGRHKGEEHFWRNINRGTPSRRDDGYNDNDGYRDLPVYRYDRRGNRYLSGTSTSSHQTNSSDEELAKDLNQTKEKENETDKDEVEKEEEEKVEEKKKEVDTESMYGGSVYDGSVYGGSVYGDGIWPRRRK